MVGRGDESAFKAQVWARVEWQILNIPKRPEEWKRVDTSRFVGTTSEGL